MKGNISDPIQMNYIAIKLESASKTWDMRFLTQILFIVREGITQPYLMEVVP